MADNHYSSPASSPRGGTFINYLRRLPRECPAGHGWADLPHNPISRYLQHPEWGLPHLKAALCSYFHQKEKQQLQNWDLKRRTILFLRLLGLSFWEPLRSHHTVGTTVNESAGWPLSLISQAKFDGVNYFLLKESIKLVPGYPMSSSDLLRFQVCTRVSPSLSLTHTSKTLIYIKQVNLKTFFNLKEKSHRYVSNPGQTTSWGACEHIRANTGCRVLC